MPTAGSVSWPTDAPPRPTPPTRCVGPLNSCRHAPQAQGVSQRLRPRAEHSYGGTRQRSASARPYGPTCSPLSASAVLLSCCRALSSSALRWSSQLVVMAVVAEHGVGSGGAEVGFEGGEGSSTCPRRGVLEGGLEEVSV